MRESGLAYVDKIRKNHNLGGKVPLVICRGHFDDGADPPCSGARRKNCKRDSKKRKK